MQFMMACKRSQNTHLNKDEMKYFHSVYKNVCDPNELFISKRLSH